MKKVCCLVAGMFLTLLIAGGASASTYEFEDMIDYWNVAGTSYGESYSFWSHPFGSVTLKENSLLLPSSISYTHDITDSVDFAAGDLVTEVWLELDFTNEDLIGDNVGSTFFGTIKWDGREYVEYTYNGSSWMEIGEVDTGQYDLAIGIDWLNDYGFLDITLSVSNPLGTGDVSLDHSRLYGIAQTFEPSPAPGSPVPEPASLILLGVGLLGLAGIARKKM